MAEIEQYTPYIVLLCYPKSKNNMKKLFFPAAIAMLVFSSCGQQAAPAMDDATIQAKADSIVGTKLEELNQQATEDLDRRMAIEVKPKADSIVAAMKAAK